MNNLYQSALYHRLLPLKHSVLHQGVNGVWKLWNTFACKLLPICLLVWSISGTALAGHASIAAAQPADSLVIRSFKQHNLELYLADEEYRYDRELSPSAPNLWERFKQWLFERIIQALGDENTSTLLRWTIYSICGLVILYVLLKLTNTSIRGLIYGESTKGRIAFSELEEDIHALDFEVLIKEAVAAGQYNRAIRLYYLKTLKTLSDKKLIDWRMNKTNHDYVQELSNTELATSFRSLTTLFEYIYYGDFTLNQLDFEEAISRFQTFEKHLQKTPHPTQLSNAATT